MTIHVFVGRNNDNSLKHMRIEVNEESLVNFCALVNRALNCWDSAPKELKDLGDMITHDRVTQDHTYKPMNTTTNTDYRSMEDQKKILAFIESNGVEAWLEHLRNNTVKEVLK